MFIQENLNWAKNFFYRHETQNLNDKKVSYHGLTSIFFLVAWNSGFWPLNCSLYIYWNIIAFCVSFCCTTKWICYMYTHTYTHTHTHIYIYTHTHTHTHTDPWRRKWQPTPVFLPGKFHGQKSLVGYCPWGCKELAMTEWVSTYTYIYPLPLEPPSQHPPTPLI